jgi:hypothetical protein
MMRPVSGFLLALLLSACTLAMPGGKAEAPAPLATEAIEVTKLDAPDGGAQAGPAPVEVGSDTEAPVVGSEAPADPETGAQPTDAESAPAEADAATSPAEAEVPAPLSPAAQACQRKGGRYVKTGSGDLRACVKETGDGGKQCSRETDCVGSCLARSGTCAPVAPLFGCNEILQADGRRVTLCLD